MVLSAAQKLTGRERVRTVSPRTIPKVFSVRWPGTSKVVLVHSMALAP